MSPWLFGALILTFASVAEPSDMVVTHSVCITGEANEGKPAERISYYAADLQMKGEYAVDVFIQEGVWVGGRVTDASTGAIVQDQIEARVLNGISQHASAPAAVQTHISPPPVTLQYRSSDGLFGPTISFVTAIQFDQVRAANRERLPNYYAERLQSVQWNARAHAAQQLALRQADQARLRDAQHEMQARLSAQQDLNAAQRAKLLYNLYLVSQKSAPIATPRLVNERISGLALTDAGRTLYLKRLQAATSSSDWEEQARYTSLLSNPWTGSTKIPGVELDDEGVLKGPALKPGSVAVSRLAVDRPDLAYRLLEAANQLQSVTKAKAYLTSMPQPRAVAQAAAVLMRSAALTSSERQIEISRALVAYFTGHADQTRFGVENEDGIYRFVEGRDMGDVASRADGLKQLAKAIYNELASDVSWMDAVPSPRTVDRIYGKAVPVKQTIGRFVGDSLLNPPDLSDFDQTYAVPIVHAEFSSTEIGRSLKSDLSHLRSSPVPQGAQAVAAAETALDFATAARGSGNLATAHEWEQTARMLADVALGFVPVAATALDAYSLIVGKNLITGEILSTTDRALAAFGLVTAGVGSKVVQSLGALRMLEESERFPHVLVKAIHKIEVLFTDALNEKLIAKGWEPAYKWASRAYKLVVPETTEKVFVRFHGPDNMMGSWIAEYKSVKRLIDDPVAIAEKFSLKYIPTHVSFVRVPAGTELIKSPVNSHILRGNGKHISTQYEIVSEPSIEWFTVFKEYGPHVKK